MRVTMTSTPARPGRTNEDFTAATPTTAVLIDGAGIPGAGALCRHGVAWYARHLGTALLALDGCLPDMLADAINRTTDAHRDTCDVAHPLSPSASVAALRISGGLLEYLVLGDAYAVLARAGGEPLVVTDPREVTISRGYEKALGEDGADRDRLLGELRAHRNRPGGFWLAKDNPRAATEAITGTLPAAGLTSATLLSNGAARLVDPFHRTDWPGLLTLLPTNIIHRVRQEESRRATPPDDATITHCTDF